MKKYYKISGFVYLAAISIIAVTLFASAAISGEPETAESKASKEELKKRAPAMEHDAPLIGELCVTCHMETKEPDPESITPKINNKHEVCNRCHKADGTTADGHCGCEDVEDPMGCEQCHTTPAMGDNPSAEDMNALCDACHVKTPQ